MKSDAGRLPRFFGKPALTQLGRRKGMIWKEFLRTHGDVIAATDFFTAEVWTPVGLVRYHVRARSRFSVRRTVSSGTKPSGGSRTKSSGLSSRSSQPKDPCIVVNGSEPFLNYYSRKAA